jgi:hypothetical protein
MNESATARAWQQMGPALCKAQGSRGMLFSVELDLPHTTDECIDGDYAVCMVEVGHDAPEKGLISGYELVSVDVRYASDKASVEAWVRDNLDALAESVSFR